MLGNQVPRHPRTADTHVAAARVWASRAACGPTVPTTCTYDRTYDVRGFAPRVIITETPQRPPSGAHHCRLGALFCRRCASNRRAAHDTCERTHAHAHASSPAPRGSRTYTCRFLLAVSRVLLSRAQHTLVAPETCNDTSAARMDARPARAEQSTQATLAERALLQGRSPYEGAAASASGSAKLGHEAALAAEHLVAGGKTDLLLRFFDSEFFDEWIAVSYLWRTKAEARWTTRR